MYTNLQIDTIDRKIKMKKTSPKKKDQGTCHNMCPVFTAIGLIANKWSINILRSLFEADKHKLRFGQLKKELGMITQRELTKHLREFEKVGIVERAVFPEVPPRVEYTLTKLGLSLLKPIKALADWAEENGAHIQKKRKEFEKKNNL
jgi:DNA-binding HxlR family transcriptional regulator